MRSPALLFALPLCLALAEGALAEGSGSAPGAPAFDPTGSHPLPNEGVERREEAAAGRGGRGSGCACGVLAHPRPAEGDVTAALGVLGCLVVAATARRLHGW